MLNAFLMAVGPVQPNEMVASEIYLCQLWRDNDLPCMWRLMTAGEGEMYAECKIHGYMIYVVDREAVRHRHEDARQKLSP